jgi:hypothetical protein
VSVLWFDSNGLQQVIIHLWKAAWCSACVDAISHSNPSSTRHCGPTGKVPPATTYAANTVLILPSFIVKLSNSTNNTNSTDNTDNTNTSIDNIDTGRKLDKCSLTYACNILKKNATTDHDFAS